MGIKYSFLYKVVRNVLFLKIAVLFSISSYAADVSPSGISSAAVETTEVVIYRSLDGESTALTAYINGHVAGVLVPGTHTQAPVCVGSFDLRLKGRKGTAFDGGQAFDAKLGQIAYFKVNPSNTRYTVERVEATRAQQELQESKSSAVISRVVANCVKPIRVVNLGADVMFVTGSAQISAAGMQQLQAFVTDTKSQISQIDNFKVIGHTDSMGSDAYNDKLSLARAKSVVQYFERQGISVPMSVEGRGERQPVSTGCERYKNNRKNMIDCLQPDRRVVIEITGKQ